MELFKHVDTAQELYEMLSQIPQAQRERLPVEIGDEETNILHTGDMWVVAFETTETEGCVERGFRIRRIL